MIPGAWLGRKIGLLLPQLCPCCRGLTFHLLQARTQRGLESSPHLLLTLCLPHLFWVPQQGQAGGSQEAGWACQSFPPLLDSGSNFPDSFYRAASPCPLP